jgi:hypothetical protein
MKKSVIAVILMLTMAFATVSAYAYIDPSTVPTISPKGPVRVALDGTAGAATWFAKAPMVYDGSFSAQLSAGSDTKGAIMIGPLSLSLSSFSNKTMSKWITFWAFHWSDVGGYDQLHQPYVIIVLDNGRVMLGVTSVPVSCTKVPCPAPLPNSFANQGYPSADLWVQMKPTDMWYTPFPSDPVSAKVSACTLTNLETYHWTNCTMANWSKAFPTSKVIQVEIVYGLWGDLGTGPVMTIYIDDASIEGKAVPIEPETISA